MTDIEEYSILYRHGKTTGYVLLDSNKIFNIKDATIVDGDLVIDSLYEVKVNELELV